MGTEPNGSSSWRSSGPFREEGRRRLAVLCLTGNLLLFAQLGPRSFLLLLQAPVSVRQQVFVGFVRQRDVRAVIIHGPGHVHCLWHLWGIKQKPCSEPLVLFLRMFCEWNIRAGSMWCNSATYWSNASVYNTTKNCFILDFWNFSPRGPHFDRFIV